MLDNKFEEKYFSGEESGHVGGYELDEGLELFFKNQISKIKRYSKESKIKICDIGCAYGFFLRMCEENRWTAFGTDISNHVIDEAKKSLKAELQVHTIEKAPPSPLKNLM